eukprot:359062-Chlamydomonas_euryale.AAC.14
MHARYTHASGHLRVQVTASVTDNGAADAGTGGANKVPAGARQTRPSHVLPDRLDGRPHGLSQHSVKNRTHPCALVPAATAAACQPAQQLTTACPADQ